MNMDNFASYVLTSNNDYCVKVGLNDRHYAIMKCNASKVGDYKYFDEIAKSMNQNTGDHLFTFLKNLPDDAVVDIRRTPETDIKKDLKDMAKPKPMVFIEEIIKGEYAVPKFAVNKESEEYFVSISDLYELFRNWCRARNFNEGNAITFSREGATKLLKTHRQAGGNRTRGYLLPQTTKITEN